MSLATCQVGVAFIFELLVQSIGMPKLASKWPAKLLNERFHPALVAVEEFQQHGWSRLLAPAWRACFINRHVIFPQGHALGPVWVIDLQACLDDDPTLRKTYPNSFFFWMAACPYLLETKQGFLFLVSRRLRTENLAWLVRVVRA